jgi:hypothetical protein
MASAPSSTPLIGVAPDCRTMVVSRIMVQEM